MSILGLEQLDISMRVVTIIGPIALYFMLLGLLNTRLNPQMLTGRQDFSMLLIAISPLVLQPMVYYLGGGSAMVVACAILIFGAIWLLSPRGRTFVIYNLPRKQGIDIVLKSLDSIGLEGKLTARGIELPQGKGIVHIDSFLMLRNFSLKLTGGCGETWEAFEENMAERLGKIETPASPMAVTLLLIATGMIVAPMVLMIHHAPEIVRILTDLLQ